MSTAKRPRWLYCHREFMGGTWGLGDRHELFVDLYSAMNGAFMGEEFIAPVPNAWPQFGALEQYHGYPWWVGYWEVFKDGKRHERLCVAQFASWSEAFFYAEARQARDDKIDYGRNWEVIFTWHRTHEAARAAKAGQLVYLERLRAYWLRDKRKAEERDRAKAAKIQRREALAAA